MKNYLIFSSIVILSFSLTKAYSQCPDIVCPSDISVNTSSGVCEEVVSYTDPVVTDPCNSNTLTYTYTGAVQTWTVPSGVDTITVDVYGAQGGANWVNNVNYGGHVQADLPVTPGSVLNIYVGEQPNGITGGWNGGGNGETAGQGGGGASDIRIGGTTLNDRVIVAGGAGGAGYWSAEHVVGGLGGGLIGGPGYRTATTTPGGDPGTQTSSGNGTCVSFNNPSVTGGFGFGGSPSGCGCEGYGGGGGWYGGAGSGNCRGGGGGSSYTDPSAINVTHNQGVRIGHGEVVISWNSSSNLTTSQLAGLSSGSTFPVGTTINTFEVSDGNGNTDQCSFNIIVVDAEAPAPDSAALSDVEVECEANSLDAPTATDVCDGTINATSDAVFPITNDTVVVWTYEDAAGNTVTQNQNVVITGLDVSVSVTGITLTANNSGATYQWIDCSDSSSVADANGQSFTPTQNGDYAVIITDGNCTDTSACETITSVGLQENQLVNSMQIFPNPNNGSFTLDLGQMVTKGEIQVLDLNGRIVQSKSIENTQEIEMNVTQESGVYMIKVITGDGQAMIRVVKND